MDDRPRTTRVGKRHLTESRRGNRGARSSRQLASHLRRPFFACIVPLACGATLFALDGCAPRSDAGLAASPASTGERAPSPGAQSPGAQSPEPSASSAETAAATENTAASSGVARPDAASRILVNGQASFDDVALVALRALHENDSTALLGLLVTREEYLELLFPEFEAAKRRSNKPPELHWQLLRGRSLVGIRRAIRDWGGRDFELLEARATGGIEPHDTYRFHKTIELDVRDRATGTPATLGFTGSILELDGQFKLLSYRD